MEWWRELTGKLVLDETASAISYHADDSAVYLGGAEMTYTRYMCLSTIIYTLTRPRALRTGITRLRYTC